MMFCSETIAVSPEKKFSMTPPKKASVPDSYNIIVKKVTQAPVHPGTRKSWLSISSGKCMLISNEMLQDAGQKHRPTTTTEIRSSLGDSTYKLACE